MTFCDNEPVLLVSIKSFEFLWRSTSIYPTCKCAWHGKGLLPERDVAGLGRRDEAWPGLPEIGKDRQLEPSEGRDNMEKDEEEQHIRKRWRRISANRVSSHLIPFVFYISVIAGILIVTTVFFSFRRINHMVLNHLKWSSVYTLLIIMSRTVNTVDIKCLYSVQHTLLHGIYPPTIGKQALRRRRRLRKKSTKTPPPPLHATLSPVLHIYHF